MNYRTNNSKVVKKKYRDIIVFRKIKIGNCFKIKKKFKNYALKELIPKNSKHDQIYCIILFCVRITIY
jgi:hypothetical protein